MPRGLGSAPLLLIFTGMFYLNKIGLGQPGEMSSASCENCTDIVPEGPYNCLEQKFFGKCNASWMKEGGYCFETCGFCEKCTMESIRSVGLDAPEDSTFSPSIPILRDTNGADCSCTDVQPPGPYTCQEQMRSGKCKAIWMINVPQLEEGFCQITCGRCECMNPTENEIPGPAPPTKEDCSCTDVTPPGQNISCQEQKSYGKCEADWMLDRTVHVEGYCQTTCGRCFCLATDPPADTLAPSPPPPAFVPPMRVSVPSPEPMQTPAQLQPDPLGRSSFPILSVSPPHLQMPMYSPSPRPKARSTVVSRVPIIVVPIERVPSSLPQDSAESVIPAPEISLDPNAEVTSPASEPVTEKEKDLEAIGEPIDWTVMSENLHQPLDEDGEELVLGPVDEWFPEPDYDDAGLDLPMGTTLFEPDVEPLDNPDFELDVGGTQPDHYPFETPVVDDLDDFAITSDMPPNLEPMDDLDTEFWALEREDVMPMKEPSGEAVGISNNIIFSDPSMEPSSDQEVDNLIEEIMEPVEEPSSEFLAQETVERIKDEMEVLIEPSNEPATDDFEHQVSDQLEEGIPVPGAESIRAVDVEIMDIDTDLLIEPAPELSAHEDLEPVTPIVEGDAELSEENEELYFEDISDIEHDPNTNGKFLFGPSLEPLVEPNAEPLVDDLEEITQVQTDREKKHELEPATETVKSSIPFNKQYGMVPSSEASALDFEDDLVEFEDSAAEVSTSSSDSKDADISMEFEEAPAPVPFEEVLPGSTEEQSVAFVAPLEEEGRNLPAGPGAKPDLAPVEETDLSPSHKLPSRDNCTTTDMLLRSKEDISIFRSMIKAARLMDDEGNLLFKGTLFIPNNQAVEIFLAANGLELVELLEQDILLKALISFFIVDEVLYLEDLYNGMQVKPRVTGAEPLVILRTDLKIRGNIQSIIVIVGARDTTRVVESGLVSCDVAVHIVDRFLPPSVAGPPISPPPESTILEEVESGLDTNLSPTEELIPSGSADTTVDARAPSPQLDTKIGLSMSVLEGILDYEDDPANNQATTAENAPDSGSPRNREQRETTGGGG